MTFPFIKTVVVDQSPIAVLGATTILLGAGINVIDSHTRLAQLAALLAAHTGALALVDPFALDMPAEDSLFLLAEAIRSYPSVAVTAFTEINDDGVASRLRDIGVKGLVDKRSPWTHLPAALYATASGGHYGCGRWAQETRPNQSFSTRMTSMS